MSSFHPLITQVFERAGINPDNLERGTHPRDPETGIRYFIKTGPIDQLKAEHLSLVHLSKSSPSGFVPRSFGIAEKDGKGGMVSEFFDLGGKKDQRELGLALASAHRHESGRTKFGFEVDTFCGVTRQSNSWKDSWTEFYVENRLGDLVTRLNDSSISHEWEKMQQR